MKTSQEPRPEPRATAADYAVCILAIGVMVMLWLAFDGSGCGALANDPNRPDANRPMLPVNDGQVAVAAQAPGDAAGSPPPAAVEPAGGQAPLHLPAAGDLSRRGEAKPERDGAQRDAPLSRLLEAIWQVETRRGADLRRGDGGRAAGHLQQHREHWERGCKALGVSWAWPAATADRPKCFAVAVANWRLDCPEALVAGDAEALARHFRLPGAPGRRDNDDYWRRVRAALKAAR